MVRALFSLVLLSSLTTVIIVANEGILDVHPRLSYRDVKDIDAMEAAIRQSHAAVERHSFSRAWWKWDRLRERFVDEERTDKNALRILRAVFRGSLLDRHARLAEKDEGDLLYIFFSISRPHKADAFSARSSSKTAHRKFG